MEVNRPKKKKRKRTNSTKTLTILQLVSDLIDGYLCRFYHPESRDKDMILLLSIIFSHRYLKYGFQQINALFEYQLDYTELQNCFTTNKDYKKLCNSLDRHLKKTKKTFEKDKSNVYSLVVHTLENYPQIVEYFQDNKNEYIDIDEGIINWIVFMHLEDYYKYDYSEINYFSKERLTRKPFQQSASSSLHHLYQAIFRKTDLSKYQYNFRHTPDWNEINSYEPNYSGKYLGHIRREKKIPGNTKWGTLCLYDNYDEEDIYNRDY